MKSSYTLPCVPDVFASLSRIEQAFGLQRRFLHASGTCGETDTGETISSFALHELVARSLAGGHVQAQVSNVPLGLEGDRRAAAPR